MTRRRASDPLDTDVTTGGGDAGAPDPASPFEAAQGLLQAAITEVQPERAASPSARQRSRGPSASAPLETAAVATPPVSKSRTRRAPRPSPKPPVESHSAMGGAVLASIKALEDEIDRMRARGSLAGTAVPAVDEPEAETVPAMPDLHQGEPTLAVAEMDERESADDDATLPNVPAVAAVAVGAGTRDPAEPAEMLVPRARRARRQVAGGRRHTSLAVAAILVVVALLAASVVLLTRDETGEAADPGTRSVQATARFAFDPITTAEGAVVTRSWALRGAEGDRVVGTLSFANPTPETVETAHVEVIPKSLAASVDDIRFDPEPTVLEADPVVQYKVTVPAGERVIVRYEIRVPAKGVARSRLEAWAADASRAAVATTSTTTTTTTTTTSTPPPTAPPVPPAPAPVAAPEPGAAPGAIVVRLVTQGAAGTFRFVGPGGSTSLTTTTRGSAQSAPIPIAPGTYSWAQVSAPPGTTIVGVGCSDGESTGSGGTATYHVQAGETVVCTWTNA